MQKQYIQYRYQKCNKLLQEKKKKLAKKAVKLKKFNITNNIKYILDIILL